MRPGCALLTAHFMNSSATRSRASVEYSLAMERDMAAVPASTVRLKRQANCIPRRTRRGSSEKASLVARRMRLFEIHLAAEEVPDFAGERVEAHGVDGEVAAGGGFARGDGGVEVGVENRGGRGRFCCRGGGR